MILAIVRVIGRVLWYLGQALGTLARDIHVTRGMTPEQQEIYFEHRFAQELHGLRAAIDKVRLDG